MRRTIKIALYVVMSMFIAASLMLTGCESEKLTTQEILTNTISAMVKVDSYKMDYEMVMAMEATSDGDTMKMTADVFGTAVTDVRNQKTQMSMDISMDIPDVGIQQMSMEMYSVEGWQYAKVAVPGAGEQWSKMKNPYAVSQDQMTQLTGLMISSTSSSLLGSAMVNGTDCYILEIVPDITALWQWLMSQQGSDLAGGIDISEYDLSEIIKSYGCKYWIAKNNFQMMKSEADMSMEMNAETFGGEAEDLDNMTMTMNMTMTFSDYDETVTIELPEEVLDAEEISVP